MIIDIYNEKQSNEMRNGQVESLSFQDLIPHGPTNFSQIR